LSDNSKVKLLPALKGSATTTSTWMFVPEQ
jgi:hypothetical protein